MNWEPTAAPFRAMHYVQAGPALHGWATRIIATCATLEEAKALVDAPFGRGVMYGVVDEAVNAATWNKNGRWKRVYRRDRKLRAST